MRKFAIRSLVAATLVFGIAACDSADPNAFETHIKSLENADTRAMGFNELERLVKSIVANDNADRKKEFIEKVLPAFEARWEDSAPHRTQMLEMLRLIRDPAGTAIWVKALEYDGSAEGRKQLLLALQGISESKAQAAAGDVIKQLDALITNPSKDTGDREGELRLEYAKAIAALRAKEATPVLIKCLQQTKDKQPVAVHKECVKAAERIGDDAISEELLTVAFRVPDAPGTQSIGERTKRAIVAIGEPAVDDVLKMLAGENTTINDLAAENGVDVQIVKQTAAGILGPLGSPTATSALVDFMPKEDCNPDAGPAEEPDPEMVGLRAFVANALGFLGDEAAVPALCGCRHATHNPGDLWEITTALGRIGGPEAFQCLNDIIATGEYDPENLPNSDFRYEIRWEGARWLILAADPGNSATARKVIESQTDPKVKENIGKWLVGLDTLDKCKADKACYQGVLADSSAEWFAREKAAVELYRLGKGDTAVALEIAKAFKVRDSGARVTMAWLTARTADGKDCYECADALDAVMKSEKGNADPTMQLAWLTARQSIAKLTRGPEPAAAGGGGEAPAEEAASAEEKKEG